MRRWSVPRRDEAGMSALAIAMGTETRGTPRFLRAFVGALLLSLVLAALAVGAAQAGSSAPNIGIPLTPTTVAATATPTTAAGASATPTTALGAPAATSPLNPGLRFTKGTVQFLPEYDSMEVLVIIDYALLAGAKTPFTFQFRVPGNARMTGYALVDANGSFDYSRPAPTVTQGDVWDVVTVVVPKFKPVHIEYYYDPGLSQNGQRDFAVVFDPPAVIDQLTLQVQEPRRATGFAVSPGFAQTTQGSDGFAFREESRSAVQPGQPTIAKVSYAKPDAQPSLPPASGTGSIAGGSSSASTPGAGGGSGGSSYLLWVLLAAAAAVAGIVAYRLPARRPAAATSRAAHVSGRTRAIQAPVSPSRRAPQKDLETAGGSQRFCTECGESFVSTDRFCRQCGQEREGM